MQSPEQFQIQTENHLYLFSVQGLCLHITDDRHYYVHGHVVGDQTHHAITQQPIMAS